VQAGCERCQSSAPTSRAVMSAAAAPLPASSSVSRHAICCLRLSLQPECKCGVNDKVLFEAQGRSGRQKAVDLEDVSRAAGSRGRKG